MSDTPNSTARQQQEAARFRSAVSESLLQGMQGNINYLLASVMPIGSVIHSYLTESQFQSFAGIGWVLDIGQSIAGSDLAVATGITTLADLRGVTIRGKNHARSTGTGNASGDLAIGTYQADQNKLHTHTPSTPDLEQYSDVPGLGRGDGTPGDFYETAPITVALSSDGGTEARVRSVTLNTFVRIN